MWAASGLGGSYLINQSIRFNDDDSAYMYRIPSVAGNRKTWTWSGWVKRGNSGLTLSLLSADDLGVPGDRDIFFFNATDNLQFALANGTTNLVSTAVFRDPSASYHIVVTLDTTQATAANRVKVYVNGVQLTSFSTETYPALNYDCVCINTTKKQLLGAAYQAPNYYFDGYLADVHFIDGAALTAASFGETDAFGNWVPVEYAGTDATSDYLSTSGKTLIGDMTAYGGLADSWNGAPDAYFSTRCTVLPGGDQTGPGYSGVDWGSGVTKTVDRCFVSTPIDHTFQPGGTNNITLVLEGSTDNFSASTVTLGTEVVGTSVLNTYYEITGLTTTTAYRYHRVKIQSSGAGGRIVIGEI